MADTAPHLHLVPDLHRPAARVHEPLWRHLLGDELRRLRHRRGETLDRTAARAGVSPQYLSEMERGRKDPSSEMVAAVAEALGVTLVDLTLAVARALGATVAAAPSEGIEPMVLTSRPAPAGLAPAVSPPTGPVLLLAA